MTFSLELLGSFRLFDQHGTRIEIASRKGQALIAMLAVAGGAERTRGWLQGQLWGSRQPDQAKASLRSELSQLRGQLNQGGVNVLQSDNSRVWLNLEHLHVDARRDDAGWEPAQFLEGIDIPGEEGFEDWLRQERARLVERAARRMAIPPPVPPPTATNGSAPTFTRLPTLAVMPFVNLTGDDENTILAEGISEDMIDTLSRLRWLPVIARSSSFALRDPGLDARTAGEQLGARYVLEGRLRKGGNGLALAASLADSETGQVMWSNRLHIDQIGSPDGMHQFLTGLTSLLGARIDLEEQVRALRKPQSDLNVRDLIWRGRWHLNRFTESDARAAERCFAEALALEPTSPEAIIQATWARVWDLWARRASEADFRALRQMAQRAIVADCDDARGHMLAGIAEIWLRQPLRAEALLRRAIELNPSLVMAYAQLGSALRLRGEDDLAIEALETAMRLSPNDHDMFFFLGELASAHLMKGALDQAARLADEAITRRASYWYAYVLKANALARLGRGEAAAAALSELGSVKPGFVLEYLDWQPFIDPRRNQFLKDGVNLARGWRD